VLEELPYSETTDDLPQPISGHMARHRPELLLGAVVSDLELSPGGPRLTNASPPRGQDGHEV